jgi:hypothetical protein
VAAFEPPAPRRPEPRGPAPRAAPRRDGAGAWLPRLLALAALLAVALVVATLLGLL